MRSKRTKSAPVEERPTVLVVDDDPSVLRALARLLRAANFEARTFDRPSVLLGAEIPQHNACLLLDVNLPEMNGPELYEALAASGHGLPTIIITGRSVAPAELLAQRVRAVALLFKPFDESLLLDAISRAIAQSGTGPGN